MKFIAKQGAPDIPLRLLEAQETGRLALFCGAGISYPAGLPGFKGLVDSIYAKLGSTPKPLEKAALRQRLYDRVLELVERRHHKGPGKSNPMRELLGDLLEIKHGANLRTHKSILQIATSPTGERRLVTTNFDHGFLLAGPRSKNHTHAAPRLPVPKPHKWNSIVYLHGILDAENDPGSDHVVLTSGDFGAAYLTERWASKFVTELFAHYTVLFVGYSIDDPVIRYMTDAIAADRRLGYNEVDAPYALARTMPSRIASDEEAWRAKGVEPVLYHSDRLHGHLHRTLEKWAEYCRDGLNAKERIIRTKAPTPPLPPYENDETVNQIVDILREKVDLSGAVSGHPARVFADIDDPPAPIEWLPVLEAEGLMKWAVAPGHVQPVHGAHGTGLYAKPNLVSFNIWRWLCSHLGSIPLVNWVIDRGGCLHPDFAFHVTRVLDGKNPPPAPFDSFWRVLTLGLVECGGENSDSDFFEVKKGIALRDEIPIRAAIRLMAPRVKFEKSFNWAAVYEELHEVPPETEPFDVKVVIALSEWMFNELTELETYPSVFVDFLPTITGNLLEAIQLWSAFGKADAQSDRSYWDLPSIEPHAQNNRFSSWAYLIEACRDVWIGAWEEKEELARGVFELWGSLDYPVFRRLALFAAAQKPVRSPARALDLLLANGSWWLWSIEVRREKYRLLARIWPELPDPVANELESKILSGPPREMYKEDLADDRWTEIVNREIWHHLAKLRSFGRDLTERGNTRLQELEAENPQWALEGDDRDEFVTWSESSTGHRTDTSAGQLISKEVADRVIFLLDKDTEFYEGRIDGFRTSSQEEPSVALETLQYMANQENWDAEIWHAGLMGIASSSEPQLTSVFQLIAEADELLFRQEPWIVAYWLRNASKEIEPDSPLEQEYWAIYDKVLRVSLRRDVDPGQEIVTSALNDPVGILAESLLDRLGSRQLAKNAGLPREEFAERLEFLLSLQECPGLFGNVILFSRLHYFHAVDPTWSREQMIPHLDWQESQNAKYYWIGFLWAPRISIELAGDTRENLLAGLHNTDNLGNRSNRIIELFATVCLEYPDVYSRSEKTDAMATVGADGHSAIAKFIWRSLRVDSNAEEGPDQAVGELQRQPNDNYWDGRVSQFIVNHWSKDSRFRSSKRSENLALAALQLTTTFPDAVETVRPFLSSTSNLGFVVRTALKKRLLLRHFPNEMFALLDELFTPEWQYPDRALREILALLVQDAPELRDENRRYHEMDQFLIRHNL